MAGRNAEHRLNVRRAQEDYIESMQKTIHSDFVLKANATWENKQHDGIEKRRVEQRMSALEARETAALEGRRQRLSDLLNAESQANLAALEGMKETPEQRLQKMESRARALRENAEIERKQFVEESLYKRWRRDCDDLRERDSKVVLLSCAQDRQQQLAEKAKKFHVEREEDSIWAELWEEDRQKKELRAEQDAARVAAMNKTIRSTPQSD